MSQNRNYKSNPNQKYKPYSTQNRQTYQRNVNNNYSSFDRCKYIILNDSNAELNIHPISSHDQDFPNFKKPIEIGILLSDKRKNYIEEKKRNNEHGFEKAQGLKFLALPENIYNCNFDLKIGIEKFVPHIPHQHGIDTLLKWILENKEKVVQSSNLSLNQNHKTKLLKQDFICWRGLLTTILVTPYEKNSDWMFSIILYNGNYYLCELETELDKFERLNMDEKAKSFSYWGHKFESYITSDLPGQNSFGADDVPDPENNFSTVITTSLDEHSLLYCAEIDCCIENEHRLLNDYCEIKTHRGNSIEDLNFERNLKFLKWWNQSFLVNIELIKVGLRDDEGLVKKIIDCKINEKLSNAKNRWWKENVCFNFLKSILDLIKSFCVEENQVYIAYREKGSGVVKIYKTLKDSEEFKKNYFIRDWFSSAL